jgi:acetyltransferase-like isoleucine patch superfamily enzyme
MIFIEFLTRKLKNALMRIRIANLRRRGVTIGENTLIYRALFDAQFPFLISVGSSSIITHGCIILAHDASLVLHMNKTRIGPVSIGNNVFLGINAIVLPGV